jgi:hypothetical protein
MNDTSVPFDDASLGFTATDLLGKLASPAAGQLIWYDGTSTAVHFQIRYDHPAVHIWKTAPAGCGEMDVDGAIVSLTTDDGRLSGDDFPGRLSANILGEPTTIIWVDLSGPHVPDLHGSFRAPSSWGADVQAQTLTLALAPRAETCSVCAASSGPRDPGFSSTSPDLGCAYDGKIFWNGSYDSLRGCRSQVTVAAWQWSQQP